jgi:hypothetical protein
MKLIKKESNYYLCIEENGSNSRNFIASTDGMYVEHKLSKENCDEIFGVDDVDKLGQKHYEVHIKRGHTQEDSLQRKIDFIIGFSKAMELNKDKLFGVKEVVELCKILLSNPFEKCGKTYQELTDNYIQSLQQPTEIEVEIKMICPHPSDTYRCGLEFGCDEDGCNNPIQIPFTDSNGCIFIRKKYYEK